ncbi:Alpha/Beta hydrolase fold [Arabidopsis thaliana x Arabidopsis arenosa]|uniref:Alpha/Beta hydrolase fold n=1 Tax=Arabidopsis thaliana x Arabidopsis arenosa TaxID=1240361 RepID=A0A8T2C438_9BRAS|nr:Alpha/Beta hydrolase fold [Arabidopsis thaliana x Arabidopsis arenosa]
MSKAWKLKLLLLLQLLLLSQHDVDSASVISYLPGFEGLLPFHLETGYIGVGEGEKEQLFYYFIKSENNHEEDPLIIWLTGGPACTALSALAFEIGPLTFKTKGYNGGLPSLVSTTYSWTKVASIIFLDQPVGTGFSYSTSPLSHKPSDTGEAKQTYEFLQKWLVENPEFVSNPFYVGGDSYAGIVVPAIVQQISIGNEHGYNSQINLKGYILGNPSTDLDSDHNSKIPYAHRMGLISDELYESLKRTCQGNYVKVDPTNIQCLKLMENYQKCVSRINEGFILIALCDLASPNPYSGEHGERTYLTTLVQSDLSLPTPDCYMYRYLLASHWANDEDVRKALHVVKGSIGKWMRCNWDLPYEKDIKSSVPYHRNNSIKGDYRSLIYSGDHDMMVPYTGTEAWIKSLNYSITDDWRPWFANNQVIGYTRTYANNMTFATIKGGGHTAEYKPEESFIMFQRWISGRPL